MKKLEREICKELEAIDKEIDISKLRISEKEDLGESDPLKECLICFEEVPFIEIFVTKFEKAIVFFQTGN